VSVSQSSSSLVADIDTVVSCVGRSVISQQIPLIQWAAESSVTRFFPSEYGTDVEYSPKSATEKPHQQKLHVRRYMATVKKLEWTYLATGPYSELYFVCIPGRSEIGGFDVRERKACLLGNGKGRVSFTAMAEYDFFNDTISRR
jgi:NmrA-like family